MKVLSHQRPIPFDEAKRAVKQVAVHFETGPGDTLRLVHALSVLIEREAIAQPVLILTTEAGLRKASGMFGAKGDATFFSDGEFLWSYDSPALWCAPHSYDFSQLKWNDERAADILDRLNIDPEVLRFGIVHVHFMNERDWEGQITLSNGKVFRRRIDSSAIMNSAKLFRFVSERPARGQSLRVLQILRKHKQKMDNRDTPIEEIIIMKELANEMNFDLTFGGLENQDEYRQLGIDLSDCISFSSSTYVDQILEYSNFDCVVGTNSSALDLALAGGLPGLRNCEFQGLGAKPWGRDYNTYLASSLNIGLEPPIKPRPKRFWFDTEQILRFRDSAKAFLSIVHDSEELPPVHSVLPNPNRLTRRDWQQQIERFRATTIGV